MFNYKKNIGACFLLILLIQIVVQAQGASVNTTGNPADASAMLDVSSTTQGILIPRMSEVQRSGISNPATGLLVYQTDGTAGFYYNAGTSGSPNWVILSSPAAGGTTQWTTSGSDIYYNSGKVSIGTTSFSSDQKVNVRGSDPYVLNVVNEFSGLSGIERQAIRGVSFNAPGFGTGVYGEGGQIGGNFFGNGSTYEGQSVGVFGIATGNAGSRYGVWGAAGGVPSYAGYFSGDVQIEGTLSKSAGSFKIDHPLDPANKYLSHSFVESPDMLNIYNGNVRTDVNGDAVVQLPPYFETLNIEYKYQLTVIGQFAQAIIAQKISNNQFTIKTDKPNVEVSWQVTGVRNDPYAQQHRIIPEENKNLNEKGKYLNPALYNMPENMAIHQPPKAEKTSVKSDK